MIQPIQDIYEAGFDTNLIRNPITELRGSTVEVAPTIAPYDDQSYENALTVEEVVDVTHTTEASGDDYFAVSEVQYKNHNLPRAPFCLAYLVSGSQTGLDWKQLPFFLPSTTLEPTTNSFFIQEQHIVSCRRRYLTITSFSTSAETYVFRVFILKNKNDRTN